MLIGLTGGIGSGKSTAASFLRQQGFVVIDADQVGHQVLLKGESAYDAVVSHFGRDILDEQEEIVRPRLAKIVFQNLGELEKLNQITHPCIRKEVEKQWHAAQKTSKHGWVFLEAALLTGDYWKSTCDQIWAVEVPPETAIARVQERNGFSYEQAAARVRSQPSNAERAEFANVVIPNISTPEALYEMLQQHLP